MKARAYVHRFGIIYISWVYDLGSENDIYPYYSNNKTLFIEPAHISYFWLSFSEKRSYKRLKRFCEKHYK